jgi:hypothetical protein
MHWTFSRMQPTGTEPARVGLRSSNIRIIVGLICSVKRRFKLQRRMLWTGQVSELTQSQIRDSNNLIMNSASRLYMQSGGLNLQLLYNQSQLERVGLAQTGLLVTK